MGRSTPSDPATIVVETRGHSMRGCGNERQSTSRQLTMAPTPTPAALSGFLSRLGDAYKAREQDAGAGLAAALVTDAASHNALKQSLGAIAVQDLPRIVSTTAHVPQSERLHAVVVSLLEFVAAHPSVAELVRARKSGRGDALPQGLISPVGCLQAYTKWAEVYARASLVFQSQQDTIYFGASLRYVATSLVLLAFTSDGLNRNSSQPSVTDAVSRISRTTGIAAIDRAPAPGELTKRRDVLWLANLSFRCYFKLSNIRLCETVLGSVENALTLNRNFATQQQKQSAAGDLSALGMACYSRADKVAYRYYLGRLRLSQHRIRAAYTELRWSFDNCTNAHMHNKTLLLTHLVVAAIILGIYPTRALLRATSLDGPFEGLIDMLRRGNGRGVYDELDRWRDWHRRGGHYLLLREKLEISAWRNLLRRR